jgi:L-alanine-DL-glutamate epimerase-like enolase superfamily enzyme
MPHPSFRIKSLEAIPLRMPFSDQVTAARAQPQGWREFDMVLVRAETTDGVVGWGECFAYGCLRAVCAAVQDMVFPLVRDREITDVQALNAELQMQLHIWGRYGITIFAISGVDIALWDIVAKMAGKPLVEVIGGAKRADVSVYASLVRYAEPRLVEDIATRAIGEGYRHIKLHEVVFDSIAAGRRAIGADVPLMTDVNCRWNVAQAEAILARLKDLNMFWVEEPVFPPEDFATLQRLQQQFAIPISAGENACTAMEFQRLTPAVTYPQPSVTKVGGISEFLKVVRHAQTLGKVPMPHSPYFGPGYWATLHLCAHLPEPSLFEFMYVKTAAWVDPDIPLPRGGRLAVPSRPGLGFAPDQDVLKRFHVSS